MADWGLARVRKLGLGTLVFVGWALSIVWVELKLGVTKFRVPVGLAVGKIKYPPRTDKSGTGLTRR